MIITPTLIPGVTIVDLERRQDERGFFARTFCREEFLAAGLEPAVEQCNLSFNHRAGTMRGLHWQAAPHAEPKLVRCTRGAIVDVAVDVRPDSPTYGQHVAVELSADDRRALAIPAFVAHGYLTLTPDTEVVYQVGGTYRPDAERGLRFDDPGLAIEWPLPVEVISEKDLAWPAFVPARQPLPSGVTA
jgi:dTDP-4-dehydrorhamnose 3,5-epimerase